jgi:hypothetical protein
LYFEHFMDSNPDEGLNSDILPYFGLYRTSYQNSNFSPAKIFPIKKLSSKFRASRRVTFLNTMESEDTIPSEPESTESGSLEVRLASKQWKTRSDAMKELT